MSETMELNDWVAIGRKTVAAASRKGEVVEFVHYKHHAIEHRVDWGFRVVTPMGSTNIKFSTSDVIEREFERNRFQAICTMIEHIDKGLGRPFRKDFF